MSLDIAVTAQPSNYEVDKQNFNTGKWIGLDEWQELFENVLQAPVEVERVENESRDRFLDRREKLFKDNVSSKGYEILARIWYIFSDVFYAPSGLNKLLEEC